MPLISSLNVFSVDGDDADHCVNNHLFSKVIVLLHAPFQSGVPVIAGQSGENADCKA